MLADKSGAINLSVFPVSWAILMCQGSGFRSFLSNGPLARQAAHRAPPLQADLGKDKKVKARFKANVKELIHQRAGGRSRVTVDPETVTSAEMKIQDIILPKRQFYEVETYRQLIGDPKRTKAKIVKRKIGKKTVHGIYVKVGQDGIYDVETRYRDETKKEKGIHKSGDALDCEEVGEAFEAAVDEMQEAHPDEGGALSLEEHQRRARLAEMASAAAAGPDGDRAHSE
eukprot:1412070-Pyramimonas_sp.AAC.2